MADGDQTGIERSGNFKRVPLSVAMGNKAGVALKWVGAVITLTYASEEVDEAVREEGVLISRVKACSVARQTGGAFHSMTQQLSQVIEPGPVMYHVCLELDTTLPFIGGRKIDRLVVSEKDEETVLVFFTDDKPGMLAKMTRNY